MRVYLIFGSQNVSALFQNSNYLARDNLTRQAFQNDTGAGSKPNVPLKKEYVREEQMQNQEAKGFDDTAATDIGRRLHDLQHLHLSQPLEVQSMTARFMEGLQLCLDATLTGEPGRGGMPKAELERSSSWHTVSLVQLLRKDMFLASTHALMGPRMLEVNPDLEEIYWNYDQAAL